MTDDLKSYANIVKGIAFTLNQFRLYSLTHPIARESIKKLMEELQRFFMTHEKITFGTMKNSLVVGGKVYDEKDPSAMDLARAFHRVGIEAVHFEKGIDQSEISSFLILIGMRPKDLEAKGGFKIAFEMAQFPHIKLSTGKFKLVEEGQVVSESEVQNIQEQLSQLIPQDSKTPKEEEKKTQTAETPKTFTSMADIIQKIKEEQTEGKTGKQTPVLDCEKIVIQLEKNPQDIASLALQQSKDPTHLEGIIRNIVNYLVDGLLSFLVEQGKDLSKALERLAKELEKSVNKALKEEDADKLKKKIPEIFEESIDELRIQMIIKTHQKNPEDPKAVEKVIKKVFKDKEVRDRLMPALKQELVDSGFQSERFDNILDSMEEKAARKKRTVSVDVEEFEELRKKAELFDQSGGGTGVGGGLEKEVQTLKKERKKLLDEKERVDTVIRNLGEGLLVVDKEGKVVLMNPAAERLLGVKQNEKLGKKVTEDLKDEHLVAMTKSNNLRDGQDGAAKNVEIVSLNDETKRVLQASTAVIENEDGETVGMVSVLSDVTKQREVERLKNQFVSNVSHELRTPLVAIQKSLGLILDKEVGEITPDQEKFLSIAHRNIDRLSRLINDLLDVAKLEEGRIVLHPKPVPMQELVLHVAGTVETWIKDKQIKLQTQFPSSSVIIEADPDRLTQVVTNLVGNAIKFTPQGHSIILDIQEISDPLISPDKCIEVGVRDTGIGIAPEDQHRIFDKFEQVSLAQPAGVSSTGLGLTIVKEIVELHSGRVLLESQVGEGSRFAFRLPKKFKLHETAKMKS